MISEEETNFRAYVAKDLKNLSADELVDRIIAVFYGHLRQQKRIEELEIALREIASCERRFDGDVVDIARRALEKGLEVDDNLE